LLDPIRLSDAVLKAKMIELGSVGYAGQYMQEPAPAEGAIFNPSWWQWYDELPPCDEVTVTVDATFGSVKESADDVAIQAWGMTGNKNYFIDRDTRKMNFSTTKAAIRSMMAKHKASFLLIEKKANGAAIIEELRSEFTIIEVNPDWGDKVARAQACSPMVEAGLAYLPSKQVWAVSIQNLAAKFPNSDKDDIDAMSQYLNWRRKHGQMLGWLKREAERAGEKKLPIEAISEHPTPAQVMQVANEQAGMKPKPKTQERKQTVTQTQVSSCTNCGSARLFRSAAGCKCLNCQNVMPTQRISKGA
jgi:predicted phage terminase large subunit-like protein